jgi:hypothetical protein
MEDADLVDGDLANEVEINFNVFSVLVLYGVGEEVDSGDVVAVCNRALAQRIVKLLKQLAQPAGLNHAIRNNAVLRLSTRVGDNVLMLR